MDKGPWLHAWYDPVAGIKTVSSLVRLADLNSDGDNKLLVCDIDKKLKVYKGTSLIVEHALLDNPISMCVTNSEISSPPVPSVAVAAGSYVFIYRHLRPHRKWSCPPIEISPTETNIWDDLRNDKINANEAVALLIQARDSGSELSNYSLDLISIDNESKRSDFVAEVKYQQAAQHTVITCMETLRKYADEPDAISLLVVGTESGNVYIIPPDPVGSSYLCRVSLKSAPVLMTVSGLFDTEWRIMVACRDGKVYNIKEGEIRGTALLTGNVIDTGSQIVALARQEKLTWVATMDRNISCYTVRGKRSGGITITDDDVVDMCVMSIKRMKVMHALLVALASGEIRMYADSKIIHRFTVEKPISAIRFGHYGREDNSLIIVHGQGGALTIKIMRRAADIDLDSNAGSGPPPEQDTPLPIPKKTKLFVEQLQREKDQGSEIHKSFQRDLCKLRLETARSYVKTLTDGFTTGASPLTNPEVRIFVQVRGLGPRFILNIALQNTGTHPITGSFLLFSFDTSLYAFGHYRREKSSGSWDSDTKASPHRQQQCLPVPVLLPGAKHVVDAELLSVHEQGLGGTVLILLASASSAVPLLSASVRMPVSEMLAVGGF